MTRILYLPSESSFYTLDSNLPPGRLILAVNSGRWRPPDGLPRRDKAVAGLRAVRLGRNTILVFQLLDNELPPPDSHPAGPLGQRQMQVLQCVAQGMTTRQVAARLGMSRRTVYLHLAAIRHSLSAVSTAEAIQRAAELGLCQPPVSDNPE